MAKPKQIGRGQFFARIVAVEGGWHWEIYERDSPAPDGQLLYAGMEGEPKPTPFANDYEAEDEARDVLLQVCEEQQRKDRWAAH